MNENTEQFIEKMIAAMIGLILLLIGALSPIEELTKKILMDVGLSLMAIGLGLQILNSVPHQVIDIISYKRLKLNGEVAEEVIPKDESFEKFKGLMEDVVSRLGTINGQWKELIEKESLEVLEEPEIIEEEKPEELSLGETVKEIKDIKTLSDTIPFLKEKE